MNIQKMIDDIAYPPTMKYNYATKEPENILKARMEVINKVAPNFFSGDNFLDIGCNKGFCSLIGNFKYIEGLDIEQRFIDVCRAVRPDGKFTLSTFRDYETDEVFDKIFIGNTMHYLFVETKGWDFIKKLAVYSNGELLIEAPTGMECKDMEACIPQELRHLFNEKEFMKEITKYFTLVNKEPSADYTPDRYVMLFKRKDDEHNTIYEVPKNCGVLKEDKNSSVLTKDGLVYKVFHNADKSLRNRIYIGAMSPISNGLKGFIKDGDLVVGWVEDRSYSSIYLYCENEKELFKLICEHNIFLNKLGYVDLDCATINFFKEDNKMFDKGLNYHTSKINSDDINSTSTNYKIHFNNSYRRLPKNYPDRIIDTLETRDNLKLENLFIELLEEQR